MGDRLGSPLGAVSFSYLPPKEPAELIAMRECNSLARANLRLCAAPQLSEKHAGRGRTLGDRSEIREGGEEEEEEEEEEGKVEVEIVEEERKRKENGENSEEKKRRRRRKRRKQVIITCTKHRFRQEMYKHRFRQEV